VRAGIARELRRHQALLEAEMPSSCASEGHMKPQGPTRRLVPYGLHDCLRARHPS
jgi:hypothetical protein